MIAGTTSTRSAARPARPLGAAAWLSLFALGGCAHFSVLDPAGPIGSGERLILLDSLAIMMMIVLPTIIATLAFAWWFRSGNKKAVYRPDWEYSGRLELLVWSVPVMVVMFLGGIGWISSHDLDPAKPIDSKVKPLEVEVVSSDWKWLFIYPDQHIASVNHLVLPTGVPVHFKLTSTTVMNSFFVPQLGSQIYTMPGMTTELFLEADKPGQYSGLSAMFSGDGFSDMTFTVDAGDQVAFDTWVKKAASSSEKLDQDAFTAYSKPGTESGQPVYGKLDDQLFERIVSMEGMAQKAQSPMTPPDPNPMPNQKGS
jgi:cytochrome o ubiquinol oxidase subunit 2